MTQPSSVEWDPTKAYFKAKPRANHGALRQAQNVSLGRTPGILITELPNFSYRIAGYGADYGAERAHPYDRHRPAIRASTPH